MTNRQIESSRETRLWIGQIIVPAVTIVATALIAMPELRHAIGDKWWAMKESIRRKFTRKKS